MADTDNTLPYRLRVVRKWHRKWWTDSAEIAFRSRVYNRRDRHDARADLRRSGEPEPRQTRGRAIRDSW